MKSNVAPGYGWGPTPRRAVNAVPRRYWKTVTFVTASRAAGLFAPVVVDGAVIHLMARRLRP